MFDECSDTTARRSPDQPPKEGERRSPSVVWSALRSGLRPSLRSAQTTDPTGHHSCRSTGHRSCRRAPAAVAAYLWIALKHEITYRKPAFLRDQLTANVVLEQVRRESAFYETTIRRGSEVIAEVKSRWCCVDAVSQRPVRVTAAVMACFFPGASEEQAAPASR
ncbi:thioesterase superfamily protein [Sphingomonas sp. LH128]|nr:thioesterase superfamily protein [Sphingomonas sp. LH128]